MDEMKKQTLESIAMALEKMPLEIVQYIAGMVDMAERLDVLEQTA